MFEQGKNLSNNSRQDDGWPLQDPSILTPPDAYLAGMQVDLHTLPACLQGVVSPFDIWYHLVPIPVPDEAGGMCTAARLLLLHFPVLKTKFHSCRMTRDCQMEPPRKASSLVCS